MVHVKGSSLTSRVLWVQLHHGAGGIDRICAEASADLRMNLERGVSKAKWYPFDQFIELNLLVDRLFGRGDLGLVKQLGRYGADANLTTIYRLFYKVGSPTWILGRTVRLWSAHYDSGLCEVATRGMRGAVLRVRAFASPHPIVCLSLAGWAERSIELSGGKRPILEETKCRTRNDDLCQFDATWE